MKASVILCAALAGSLGFGSLAVAQDGRRGDREQRAEQRQENRAERRAERRDDQRQDKRQEQRAERREDRKEQRQEQRAERREDRQEQRAERREEQRERQAQRVQRAWRQGYSARVYTTPGYGPRFYRGGYLPYSHQNDGHVTDWYNHSGLYAPPYGHRWVQIGPDYLLVAVATGLIVNLLSN